MDLKKIREKELVIRATLPSGKLLIKCLEWGFCFFSLRIEMQSLILSITFNDFKEGKRNPPNFGFSESECFNKRI